LEAGQPSPVPHSSTLGDDISEAAAVDLACTTSQKEDQNVLHARFRCAVLLRCVCLDKLTLYATCFGDL